MKLASTIVKMFTLNPNLSASKIYTELKNSGYTVTLDQVTKVIRDFPLLLDDKKNLMNTIMNSAEENDKQALEMLNKVRKITDKLEIIVDEIFELSPKEKLHLLQKLNMSIITLNSLVKTWTDVWKANREYHEKLSHTVMQTEIGTTHNVDLDESIRTKNLEYLSFLEELGKITIKDQILINQVKKSKKKEIV